MVKDPFKHKDTRALSSVAKYQGRQECCLSGPLGNWKWKATGAPGCAGVSSSSCSFLCESQVLALSACVSFSQLALCTAAHISASLASFSIVKCLCSFCLSHQCSFTPNLTSKSQKAGSRPVLQQSPHGNQVMGGSKHYSQGPPDCGTVSQLASPLDPTDSTQPNFLLSWDPQPPFQGWGST